MIETRLAEAGDVEALAALIDESCRHYFGGPSPEGVAEGWATRMAGIGEGPTLRAMLALTDRRLLGFGSFVFLDSARAAEGTLFLKNLYVAESARGGGVGEALMRALAREAASRGCERFDWTAERDNPKAQAFYAGLGAPRLEEKIYYRLDGDALTSFAKGRDDA